MYKLVLVHISKITPTLHFVTFSDTMTHKHKNVQSILVFRMYTSTKTVTCFAHEFQVNIAFSIHNLRVLHLCKLLFVSTPTTIFFPQIIATHHSTS